MRYLPEVEAIRSFSVAAEELNFRRAADRLGIDHSALSRRIRDLEHRLGFPVFERSTREVRLTEAGKLFLEENTNLLRALQRSVESARLVAEGRAGVIRIGYMSFAAASLMPGLIARFQKIHPKVRFQLTYLRSHAQKEALSRGDIDIGLMLGPWDTESFETIKIATEPLGIFFERRSSFVRGSHVVLADIANAPLIMGTLEQWDLYRWMLDDIFLAKGIVPNVVLEASSLSGIFGLVQAGLGISIFPKSVSYLTPQGVDYRILGDDELSIQTICVAGKSQSSLVKSFMQLAQEALP